MTKVVPSGYYWQVDFDTPSAEFFDHVRYGAALALRRELGPSLTAEAALRWEEVPTPDGRPIAAATERSLELLLRGEPSARLSVNGGLALDRRTTPNTPLEGDPTDLALTATMQYQLLATSTAQVSASRNRHVSAYEQNPFYTSQHVRLKLTTLLPFQLVGEAAVGLQSNTYPVPTVALGAAREDTIVGWSASLARKLRLLYARLDYTWSRRTSNVPDQSFRTNALILTIGIRPYPDPHE